MVGIDGFLVLAHFAEQIRFLEAGGQTFGRVEKHGACPGKLRQGCPIVVEKQVAHADQVHRAADAVRVQRVFLAAAKQLNGRLERGSDFGPRFVDGLSGKARF